MKEQMTTTGNSAGISGKRAQTQFRKYLLERNIHLIYFQGLRYLQAGLKYYRFLFLNMMDI